MLRQQLDDCRNELAEVYDQVIVPLNTLRKEKQVANAMLLPCMFTSLKYGAPTRNPQPLLCMGEMLSIGDKKGSVSVLLAHS